MADFWSFAEIDGSKTVSEMVREMVDLQRENGSTFYRATLVNNAHVMAAEGEVPTGLWVEGWLEVPADQGPFEPPLVTARPSDAGGV